MRKLAEQSSIHLKKLMKLVFKMVLTLNMKHVTIIRLMKQSYVLYGLVITTKKSIHSHLSTIRVAWVNNFGKDQF